MLLYYHWSRHAHCTCLKKIQSGYSCKSIALCCIAKTLLITCLQLNMTDEINAYHVTTLFSLSKYLNSVSLNFFLVHLSLIKIVHQWWMHFIILYVKITCKVQFVSLFFFMFPNFLCWKFQTLHRWYMKPFSILKSLGTGLARWWDLVWVS